MVTVRRADERGHARLSWLDTRHTFSFATYYHPEHMGFRSLRVINDDRIAPGGGFPDHPHRDMEIITYVLEGEVEHRDSLGNRLIVPAGEVQRMTAGTGIVHSEFNPSDHVPLHFLQIWIQPDRDGLEPGYEQRRLVDLEAGRGFRLIASQDGRDGSLTLHQDAKVLAAKLAPEQVERHELSPGRGAWVHVARGAARVNGRTVEEGGGVRIEFEPAMEVEGATESEVLLFDL